MTLLNTKIVEKPWGVDKIPAQFDVPAGLRVGEIWFEPPAQMPDILVKYIFTSEKLSVQVHPTDQQALELGDKGSGKEECWLVLDAKPGALLGIGFKEPTSAAEMRQAALDGTIESLMTWFPVKPGDFFYIPAGTVHAIGAGVSLVEIQQNSDITYRLYDYGRPRELHLDQGVKVAKCEPYDQSLSLSTSGVTKLVDGPYFCVDLLSCNSPPESLANCSGASLVIPLQGEARCDGQTVKVGQCYSSASSQELDLSGSSACLLVRALAERA